jgi:competence protein ComEC
VLLLLGGWCAGLLAGEAMAVPALSPPLLAIALGSGAAGGLVAAAATATPRQLGWLLFPAAVLLGGARGAAGVHVPEPAGLESRLGRQVSLTGTVERASGSPTVQSFWLADNRLGGTRVSGTVLVGARSPVAVVPGSTVRASGVLERLPGRAHDGTGGYDDRMERLGVVAAMPSATIAVISPAPAASLSAVAWRVRGALSTALRRRVPGPEAAVLLGLVVGIRSKLPPAAESDLVASGLVHLLAVSGLKVALVASTLALLLRQASRRAALLAIAGIFAYALVGGASASALRSAVMGSLSLFAQVMRRDLDPPRSLLLAAAPMLGLNPALAGDLSFQYSFLGVAGIQLMQAPIAGRLGLLPPPLRDALSVSLAAQVATLPLTAAYFHVVSVGAPLANTLVLPFLAPVMAASAWLGAGLPDPGGVIAVMVTGAAHALLATAHLAATPAVAPAVPWFALPHALAYLAALAVMLVSARLPLPTALVPRLALSALVNPAVAAACGLVVLGATVRPDGRLHLVALDTPGGGVLVTAPDGARLLVDAGSAPAPLEAALAGELGPGSPGLDTMVLTSSAPASAAGMEGLEARLPRLYLRPALADGDVPDRVGRDFARRGVMVGEIAAGDRLRWHGLDLGADGCGAGLALTVQFGATRAWLCDAGVPGDGGVPPPGPLALIDAGPGGVEPDGVGWAPRWVVSHGQRPPPVGLSAAALGPRLWRTARDGPLALACDRRGCSRS